MGMVAKHPSLLITEQEYTEYLNSSENLCCPYFSTGTTESNFRLPNYNGVFFKATNDTSKINEFETDKQRNITGSYVQLATSWDNGGRGVISFQCQELILLQMVVQLMTVYIKIPVIEQV